MLDFVATIQVKNVPSDVHAELHRRADRKGQSLQEYMLALLVGTVQEPDQDEFWDHLATHEGGDVSVEAVLAALDDVREGRDRP